MKMKWWTPPGDDLKSDFLDLNWRATHIMARLPVYAGMAPLPWFGIEQDINCHEAIKEVTDAAGSK